jgi:hypothetical protein
MEIRIRFFTENNREFGPFLFQGSRVDADENAENLRRQMGLSAVFVELTEGVWSKVRWVPWDRKKP